VLRRGYCLRDPIKENEMGEACSMYRENRNIYRVLVGKPEEMGLLEDVGVDGRGYSKALWPWGRLSFLQK